MSFWIIATCLGILFIVYLMDKSKQQRKAKIYLSENENSWQRAVQGLPFTHYWNGYGLAIDPNNRRILLQSYYREGVVQREYAFNNIREFRYSIIRGGKAYVVGTGANFSTIGQALSVACENNRIDKENAAESGFFISVKDISFPEWQIRFPDSPTLEHELKQWMEIFRQYVNEDAPVPKKIHQRLNSQAFCTSCGAGLDSSTAFCSKCGKRITG